MRPLARVEITDVTSAARGVAAGRSAITCPRPGTRDEGLALWVSGWLSGGPAPAATVEVFHQGFGLRRVPGRLSRSGRTCGYGFLVPMTGLPSAFRLELRANLADGAVVDLGVVDGRREPLRPEPTTRYQPVLIRCMGRMGTTWLIQLLSKHPAILAHRRYPYETGAARYWLHVFRVLTGPGRYAEATPAGLTRSEWRDAMVDAAELSSADPVTVGSNPLFGEYLDDGLTGLGDPHPDRTFGAWGGLVRWLGGDYGSAVGRFCRQSIDGFYDEVARLQGQPGRRYVVEKYFDTYDGVDLNWELYADAREVVLVRDLRDVLCSVFAVNAGLDQPRFGRGFFDNDADYIQELASRAAQLLRSWQDRADRVHLVRYEDLMAHPEATTTAVLEYLDVDARPETVAAMLRGALADGSRLVGHRTSGDPASSVQRWRRELPGELQAVCREAMGDTLAGFGYPRR